MEERRVEEQKLLLLEGPEDQSCGTRFIGRMKPLRLRRKSKDVQVRYEYDEGTLLVPGSGCSPRHEPQVPQNADSTSIGTVADARAHLTPSESEKLEQQEILHELICGNPTIDLPGLTLESITVPFAVFCHTCNRMILPSLEETYLG